MLRQAVVRYDIRHAVINDKKFQIWNSMGVNCWPTVMVSSPDSNPLFTKTGEGCEDTIGSILEQGLAKCIEEMKAGEGAETDWINYLSSNELPLQLEKDKQ